MATHPNTIVPELLRKDNYRKWSVWMRHYFGAQDLWEIVDPEGSVGDGMRPKEWSRKNSLALYAITTSCGEEMFDRIAAADTARYAWIKLAEEAAAPPATSVPPPDSVAQPLSRGEIEEMDATEDDGRNRLAHEGPRPGKTESEDEWRRFLVEELIHRGNYWSFNFDRFFKEHPDANPCAALHALATSAGQSSDKLKYSKWEHSFKLNYCYEKLIDMICDIKMLVTKDESGNTLASNAVRHGRESLIKALIEKNKELLEEENNNNNKDDSRLLRLTTIPDADGKIPVQLACECRNKDIIQFLYIETPSHFLHPENGDHGFRLLRDCISKKMFEIALHLLHQIPELAFYHRSRLDGTTILLTMAQFSQSPFSPHHNDQLAFWNRWFYHCINFEVKFKPSKELTSEDDQNNGGQLNNDVYTHIGFDVYTHILGISWKKGSMLKPADIPTNQQDVDANQQDAQADQLQQDEKAKQLVDEVDHQERNVEANQQDAQADHHQELDQVSISPVDQQECQVETNQLIAQADQLERDVEANQQVVQTDQQGNMLYTFFRKQVLFGCFALTYVLLILLVSLRNLVFMLYKLGLDVCEKLLVLALFIFISIPIIIYRIGLKHIHDLKLDHVYANKILNLICERSKGLSHRELVQNGSMEANFLAIKNHIPEIVIEFANKNISELWQCFDRRDPEKNMLALAVIHRQQNISSYLYKLDIENAIIIVDEDGNNLLHLVAKLAPHAQLTHKSGAALQLQSELHWFKAVEGILPRFQTGCKNKRGDLPFEVFVREHKDLMKEAEEWIKKSAESSTVVAALIITIMFTAAFTVPGGNNQDTGLPIFSNKTSFFIFIIADAISLFAAATSVLMFLGILTSRYALEDFIKSLPLKLILGLSSLFISIAAMMAAFCAALFIMLPGQLRLVTPITLIAGIPVTSFVLLQFPLLLEILYSTYNPDIFKTTSKEYLLGMEWRDLLDDFLDFERTGWALKDSVAFYKEKLRSNKDRWIGIIKM